VRSLRGESEDVGGGGCSTSASINPWRRLQHISEARTQVSTPKATWLRELAAAGHEPEMRILARSTRADWRTVEDSLVLRYPNLTNKGVEAPDEQ
jgi:hypothetical protein